MIPIRPLTWTRPDTIDRRGPNTFKAPWDRTVRLLLRELELIDATGPLLGACFTEDDMRLDGRPRAHREPTHPGVELSFTHPIQGRIAYATDVCVRWRHNVRSIALGLESLRAVDRFGITQQGEQYAGFRALPQFAGDVAAADPAAWGRAIIRQHGSVAAAIKATHPDRGGNADDLEAVLAARDAGDS